MNARNAYTALAAILLGVAANAGAAELLDVKPVVTGNAVEIQVSADIPMTYTYYKVPGQARAVVDIADADPEKVEPLIVVNKGAVSSISVDKVQISGMVVSRLIFNLIAESDISVQPTADRKQLGVTFGSLGAQVASAKQAPSAVPVVEPPANSNPEPAQPPAVVPPAASAPVEPAQEVKPAVAAAPVKDEDPLGLDEPAVKPAIKPSDRAEQPKAAAAVPNLEPAPVTKLAPVVPAMPAAVISGIVVGGNYIDIQSSRRLDKHKVIKLVKPARLAVDIADATSSMTAKAIAVNRMGISKIRVGTGKGGVRVVMDAAKKGFSKYTITTSDRGMRIHFK